jgi:hypothetical protein
MESFKLFLRDWGNLILGAAIATGAVFQAVFAARLAKLQKAFEDFRTRVDLFCSIEHLKPVNGRGTAIIRVVNLSGFGIWLEQLFVEGQKDSAV